VIQATKEAKEAWSRIETKKRSRALASSGFVDLPFDEDKKGKQTSRKNACEAIIEGQVFSQASNYWLKFLRSLEARYGNKCIRISASLKSRLLINTAGTVLENGGICLDSHFGLPYIPGSAVKGLARKVAILEISQLEDDAQLAETLWQSLLIFGWTDRDLKSGRTGDDGSGPPNSDFWWAMGAMAPLDLPKDETDSIRNEKWKRVYPFVKDKMDSVFSSIQAFAGNVSFLPAYPDADPGIELEISNSHHIDYYGGKREYATDDERPNPIVFPAVSANPNVQFHFCLLSRNDQFPELTFLAKKWLSSGLENEGIGAKTNAGYGWFEDQTLKYQEQEALREEEQQQKRRLSELEPDKSLVEDFRKMDEGKIRGIINKFSIEAEMVERLWPKSGPESEPVYQISLLTHFLEDRKETVEAEKNKKKSKVMRALNNIAKKYNREIK
tara:strand:- start:942 stop:2267 length:1326 start_codon:yes stop_codon:yes gene_type:complete